MPDAERGWPTAGQVMRIEPVLVRGYRVHLRPLIDALLAGRGGPQAP